MDYVTENNKILKDWLLSNLRYGEDDFADDGILYKGKPYSTEFGSCKDESGTENNLWEHAPLRILFITKDQNAGGEGAWDIRTETGRSHLNFNKISRLFYKNLMYQLYGLVHTTDKHICKYIFNNESARGTALHLYDTYPLARINVKKQAGNKSISNNVLRYYLQRDREFICKQISNLDADIMVCCGYSESVENTGNLLLNFLNENGYSFEPFSKNCWIYYDSIRNKVAINTYHLSYLKKTSEIIFTEMIADYHAFLRKNPQFLQKRTRIY